MTKLHNFLTKEKNKNPSGISSLFKKKMFNGDDYEDLPEEDMGEQNPEEENYGEPYEEEEHVEDQSAIIDHIENYKLLAKIANLSNCQISKALNNSTGNKCVVKYYTVPEDFEEADPSFVLSCISHPNVVKCERIIIQEKIRAIIMPIYPGGDLYFYIRENKIKDDCEDKSNYHPIKFDNAVKMMWELTDVLRHLRELGFTHGNIALENILLEPEIDPTNAILTGFSKANKGPIEVDIDTTEQDIPIYLAPEVLSNKQLNYQTDLYALGEVFHLLLESTKEYYQDTSKLPDDAKELLSGMLNPDPNTRMTIYDVKNHDFFWNHLRELVEKPSEFRSCLNTAAAYNNAIDEANFYEDQETFF